VTRSVAIALAEQYGLQRYNYDWHDSRDHSDRTRPDRHPKRAAFLAMPLEREVVRVVGDHRLGQRTGERVHVAE